MLSVHLPLSDGFHGFEFKVKFFASKNTTQIELPKLPRETKRRPALIEIHHELEPERAPQIRQAHACREWSQLGRSVKGKRSFRWHETGERVAVEMIAMRRIGGPIRV